MAFDAGAVYGRIELNTSQAQNALRGFGASIGKLGLTVAATAGGFALAQAGIAGFSQAMNSAIGIINRGIGAIDDLKLTSISMAANLQDAFPQATFDQTLEAAKAILPIIERMDVAYSGTGMELQKMADAMLRYGMAAEVLKVARDETGKLRDAFVAVAEKIKALTMGGRPFEQAVYQEIRAFSEGVANANASLSMAVKARIPDFKKEVALWKEEGTVIEHIAALFPGMVNMSKEMAGTLSAMRASWETIVNRLLRGALPTAYADLISMQEKVNRLIQDEDGQLTRIGKLLADLILAVWMSIKNVIQAAAEAIRAQFFPNANSASEVMRQLLEWVIKVGAGIAGWMPAIIAITNSIINLAKITANYWQAIGYGMLGQPLKAWQQLKEMVNAAANSASSFADAVLLAKESSRFANEWEMRTRAALQSAAKLRAAEAGRQIPDLGPMRPPPTGEDSEENKQAADNYRASLVDLKAALDEAISSEESLASVQTIAKQVERSLEQGRKAGYLNMQQYRKEMIAVTKAVNQYAAEIKKVGLEIQFENAKELISQLTQLNGATVEVTEATDDAFKVLYKMVNEGYFKGARAADDLTKAEKELIRTKDAYIKQQEELKAGALENISNLEKELNNMIKLQGVYDPVEQQTIRIAQDYEDMVDRVEEAVKDYLKATEPFWHEGMTTPESKAMTDKLKALATKYKAGEETTTLEDAKRARDREYQQYKMSLEDQWNQYFKTSLEAQIDAVHNSYTAQRADLEELARHNKQVQGSLSEWLIKLKQSEAEAVERIEAEYRMERIQATEALQQAEEQVAQSRIDQAMSRAQREADIMQRGMATQEQVLQRLVVAQEMAIERMRSLNALVESQAEQIMLRRVAEMKALGQITEANEYLLQQQAQLNELHIQHVENIEQLRAKLYELQDAAEKAGWSVKGFLLNLLEPMRDAMADAFYDMMTGLKSLGDAIADFVNSVLRSLARLAANKLAEWLFAKMMGWTGGTSTSHPTTAKTTEMPQVQSPAATSIVAMPGENEAAIASIVMDMIGLVIEKVSGQVKSTQGAGYWLQLMQMLFGAKSMPIPYAAGGIVTRPTMALVGEAGPEAIIPLNRMPALAAAGAMGGGDTYHVTIQAIDAQSFTDAFSRSRRGAMAAVQQAISENSPVGRRGLRRR